MDPRKYGSYAGVAPFGNLSGTSIKGSKWISPMANSGYVKLHLAAIKWIKEPNQSIFISRSICWKINSSQRLMKPS